MKKATYPGVLGSPMEPIVLPLLSAQAQEEAVQERSRIVLERMDALADYFGIKPDDPLKWYRLASHLAALYVPGLTIRDPEVHTGADKVWDSMRLAALVFEMDREIKGGLKPKQAAHKLSKRKPWSQILGRTADPGEAIRSQYYSAKKQSEVKAAQKWVAALHKGYVAQGMAEWERALANALATSYKPAYV